MKISYMSELHLEVESSKRGRSKKPGGLLSAAREELAVDADVVTLAGDIHPRSRGPEWAAATFPGVPVVMIAGNHEVYRAPYTPTSRGTGRRRRRSGRCRTGPAHQLAQARGLRHARPSRAGCNPLD